MLKKIDPDFEHFGNFWQWKLKNKFGLWEFWEFFEMETKKNKSGLWEFWEFLEIETKNK